MTQDRIRSRVVQLAPDLLALLALAALAFTLIRKFWQTGVASNADMLIGVYRTFELDQALKAGVLFPRIMPGLNFGYGGPLFQYYPPLTGYLSLFFNWLGLPWIESNKALFTVGLLLGGWGMYGYARFLFEKRAAALLAGAAYILSPYLLLSIYERGALAESFALALLPWLLWAAHCYVRHGGRAAWSAAAVLTAFLMLSHNITALFALPFLALFLGIMAWREKRLSRLGPLAGAAALGLGISAFYWAPAVLERSYAQIEARMLGRGGRPTDNLHSLAMLVQTHWIHDYWGPERFSLSRWQGLVALLGIVAAIVARGKLRTVVLALLASLVLAIMLQWTGLRFFWEAVPLVRFIQYPWRLLGLASVWIALLLGAFHAAIAWPRHLGWPVAAALIALIFIPVTRTLDPARAPSWYKLDSSAISRLDVYERGRTGFALYSDYAPAGMWLDPWDLAKPRPAGQIPDAPLALPGPDVRLQSEAPDRLEMHVTSDQPFTLLLPRIFFPGWRATVDGVQATATAKAPFALVSVPIAAGQHTVIASYGPTVVGLLATLVSVIALLLLVFIMLRSASTRRLLIVLAVVVALYLAVGLTRYGMHDRTHYVDGLSVTFADQIRLEGYALAGRTFAPGDTLPLRLYWLALASPSQDYKVFIHLIKPDDSGPVTQSDSHPDLGYRPMTRWDPGELVTDEHLLTLPPDLPTGRYRLLAGVYRPDTVQNLAAKGASEILPGDRVVLTDIEVQPKETR